MSWHPRWPVDLYLLGLLPSWLEASLRVHLGRCQSCRDRYDEGVLALRAARGHLEVPGLGEAERIEQRASAIAKWVPVRRGLSPRQVAAIGVGVALVIVAAVWWPRSVGEVFAAGEELTIDGEPAAVGDAIPSGAEVWAARGDSAFLLEGRRGVLLREGSRARFSAKGTEASILEGRARFAVKPGQGSFVVVAGQTRVEVKGTIFVVERRSEDETLVAVHRGEVQVSGKGGQVSLKEGQESVVAAGIPSAPRRASSDALQEDRGDFLVWLKRTWQRFLGNLDRAVGN